MKFLKAVDEKEIDLKYAFEKIQTIKITETGGDHKRRWISEYSKIEVLLPEFTEQTTIANILTKVDQAIANTEALITKYTKIKTGLMQDLLTKGIDENGNIRTEQTHEFKDSPLGSIPKEWECVLIDELANLKSGGTPSRQNSSFWNGDIPWVKTGEVNYNFIKETEEYITQKGLKMSSTVLFPKGTILMALYGQGKTRGRVSILDIDATTNQACVGFLNLKKVTTNFLYVTLTNEYEKLRDLSNDGAQKTLAVVCSKNIF
ncbi:MAG: restriction endonuclease subunit S [Saprospiraceae bacterium]|nr:restriction endonuclease subunit S [Saprospiraceae bacterium]